MYCSKCGGVLNKQDKFCSKCGREVEENKQIITEPIQNTPTPTQVSNYTQVGDRVVGSGMGEYRPIGLEYSSQNSRNFGQKRRENKTNNIGVVLLLVLILGGGIFIAIPPIKNVINRVMNKEAKRDFLVENDKQDFSSTTMVCTGYGDILDMQMTLNYEKNQLQKIKYSFIYDTRNGEDFNVNISCKDGDCTSKNGISTEEQNRLMLYMMFNMEEAICNKTGIVCLKEDGTPSYKNAFVFTPFLLNDSNLKTSYTNEFLRMSKQEIKQEMATMYGLTCEWKE